MPRKKTNLSDHKPVISVNAGRYRLGIVVSEWNEEITGNLRDGAIETLTDYGVKRSNIKIQYVPGSYELPLAAKLLCKSGTVDAVICIGCVIQGETPHFEYICSSVSSGIMDLTLDQMMPVIFGVLTVKTYQQALDRSGGRHGNKGVEAAVTALKMIELVSHAGGRLPAQKY